MVDAFEKKLGKHATVPTTTQMLAHGAAKGYANDLTPVMKLKAAGPGYKASAYDPDDKATWPFDPASGKGAFLRDKAKHPDDPGAVPGGWKEHRLTPQEIARFDCKGHGLGIVCRAAVDGSCVASIDCDITDDGFSLGTLDALRTELAALGHTRLFVRRRGSYSWLVSMVITDGVPAYEQRHTKRGKFSFERGGAGHQFVALGQHASGGWRHWSRFGLIDGQWRETPIDGMPARDELPALTLDQFHALFETVAGACGAVKGKGGHGGAPRASGSGFKYLPAEVFDHHALPTGKEAVFLAVLAALPNEKDRNAWIGCASVIIGTLRQWPEGEAFVAWMDWCAKYGGDPAADERLFREKWAERGRLREGWPEFVDWARAELAYRDLRALGVTDEDMRLADPQESQTQAARANFAAALQALWAARTEPGHRPPAKARRRRIIDLAAPSGPPQVPPAITDWHVRGELGLLAAEPGVGKTTLAVDTALAIAHERPDLIGSAMLDRAGAVVLVLNETSEDDARAMLMAGEARAGLGHASRSR